MTFRVYMRRAGKSAFRRIAVLLVFVVVLSGCDRGAPLFAVKAVAAGVPSLAPFFDESAGLGHDVGLRSRPAPGGLQQGDTPGLYGGTGEQRICDVARLEEFLTDPRNHRKAQAWATVLDITTAEIPEYLDRLTPVLLRTDTLVKNHDYKKGKSVPFDALLQAGIAVLVDPQGLPAVKCSCGNPLRPFEGDTGRISVRFEDGNQKWKGYDRDSVVAVQPAPRTLDRLALVDVDDPDRGISRPVGTTGDDDSAFDTRERRAVPDLAGTTFGRASRLLTDAGLAVAFDGGGLPPDGARVMASDPPAGTELRFGEYVTLSVADGTSGGATTPPDPSPATSQPTGDPSSDASTPSPSPSASTPSSSASTPSSSAPTSEPP
ncbi:PASTA domain-containing protein, partial [Streptomyces sp. PSKA30]|uniref:PASTA domain-containing protein n=1 Tax=Streptomyces sp. PSKA30 TaxID=2874597 RepID=UPI001CD167C4